MGLKCGIVGLPNVGKSTLFNALSSTRAEAANYPFCTIEPNISVITVPDERLELLSGLVKPEKTIPTVIEFVDIAGLVKGASRGEGLGNQFLGNIREVNAIVHVVRCFDDDNVVHVDGSVNPVRDLGIIDTELQLKDLETLEKRIIRMEKAAKSGDLRYKRELEIMHRYRMHLETGRNIRSMEAADAERELMADLFLLTDKPVIYVANVGESSLHEDNAHVLALREAVAGEEAEVLRICAALEAQIAELDDQEERRIFLEEYGLSESGLNRLISASYHLLDLITFFTAGPKEVRAWTVSRGWKAPQAAGVIHSDFERGFIRAEVIKLPDYVKYRSEAACKEAGKMTIEGKEYVVADGDVMYFRFNI